MNIREEAARLKLNSPLMSNLTHEQRNYVLEKIAEALLANKEKIFQANQIDLEAAKNSNLPTPTLKRLKFDEEKLNAVVKGIYNLIKLPDPLYHIQLERKLDEGLTLYRETCAIGVIGIIFESRPDAMVQISALCIKSGNCSILKGGSEALHTNRILFHTIDQAIVAAGVPDGCFTLAETHDDIKDLLDCHESVDLLIPRGSNSFVQYIMNNTKIPVMGHADGICHIYADRVIDLEKAIRVIVDSKTQYVSVCNAAETLLIHKEVAKELLPPLCKALRDKSVLIKGTKEVQDIIACEEATEEDFKTEYLDYIISVKLVDNVDEAIMHINKYGSHHTDCIITEDQQAADRFLRLVDSAGVYQNCSTRFADGYRYGFGAEVGISTSKLHARGPVGLEGLVTYKYKLIGDGHIVNDYATGKKNFLFDLEQ